MTRNSTIRDRNHSFFRKNNSIIIYNETQSDQAAPIKENSDEWKMSLDYKRFSGRNSFL